MNLLALDDSSQPWLKKISKEDYDNILEVIRKYIKKADSLREEFMSEQQPIIKAVCEKYNF